MNAGTLSSLSGIARFGRQRGAPRAWALDVRRDKTPAVSTQCRTRRRFDVDAKTNERKAVLELYGIFPSRGKLVTGVAMFCQRDLAANVIAEEGDDFFAANDNQPGLLADIQAAFGFAAARSIAAAISP